MKWTDRWGWSVLSRHIGGKYGLMQRCTDFPRQNGVLSCMLRQCTNHGTLRFQLIEREASKSCTAEIGDGFTREQKTMSSPTRSWCVFPFKCEELIDTSELPRPLCSSPCSHAGLYTAPPRWERSWRLNSTVLYSTVLPTLQ